MQGALLETNYFMSSLSCAIRHLALLCWTCASVAAVHSEPVFLPQGTEYPVTRGKIGDQTNPQLSLRPEGGYVVWQDNGIDGDGLGIGAVALNSYLSPISTRLVRVNQIASGDQENPCVQVLPDGGAVFVWQGGITGQQDIYARVMSPAGTFVTDDLRVNSYTAGQQGTPAIARLKNGNLVVVWSSYDQDGSMQGVFSQRLSPDGAKLGDETQVNQFSSYNQRSPAVASLEDGGYVVVWVSEQQRHLNSVDVYARRYSSEGASLGNEFGVNTPSNVCANATVCGVPGGGFVVAWSQLAFDQVNNAWDIAASVIDRNGVLQGAEFTVNTSVAESQHSPRAAILGNQVFIAWVSERQDGSREGIYGRYLGADGSPAGEEFRINTTTVNRQIQPAVAGDGQKRFLAVWTGFVGGAASFEVLGQRYAADTSLPQPEPPFVVALDSSSLLVSWPEAVGYTNLVGYRFYKDGETTPTLVTSNYVVVKRLYTDSTHTFRIAIELADDQVSPVSEPATGKTWGWDDNGDTIPDDWQVAYWQGPAATWPGRDVDSDGDGATNWEEFLAGTNPLEKTSVLQLRLSPTAGGTGLLVEWNAVQGSVYQLQSSADLKNWANQGSPQLAASATGQTVIPASQSAAYYRVIRVR